MYNRQISSYLLKTVANFPVLTLIGPRQAGKSTLARMLFPSYPYVSLEDPDRQSLAQEDPRRFFQLHGDQIIIDEVQRVPQLLSYIQTLVDEPGNKRHFVLTGSNHLLLMQGVTQSLAGRTIVAKLLPLSKKEIAQDSQLGQMTLEDFLFTGGYPRIYDRKIPPQQWLQQYYLTYVERDVRSLLNISDLDLFQRFIRLCAARVGGLLNYSSLANDCGVSQPTASSWLSLLQTSFICFTLKPHFKNFSKRLIKSPKLYFYDTGLLCYLLQIQNAKSLLDHPLRGMIFENWVISEKIKSEYNEGREPAFYFWRDTKGHEVDLIQDQGTSLYPIEIKSSKTFHKDFVKGLDYLNVLQKIEGTICRGECFYAGQESFGFKDYQIRSWSEV